MTDDGRLSRAERKAQEVRAMWDVRVQEVRELAQISDEELILRTPANTSLTRPRPQMEMQRRLKDAVERLTAGADHLSAVRR